MKEDSDEDIELYFEHYRSNQLCTAISDMIKLKFRDIKELEVDYDNGFKVRFNDNRFTLTEVYEYIIKMLSNPC